MFLTGWGRFSWLLHCYSFKFSLSVDCLCLEFVGFSLCVGQNNLLALLPISRPLLAFYSVYCHLSQYFVDLWFFANKFYLEIFCCLLLISQWTWLKFFFLLKFIN